MSYCHYQFCGNSVSQIEKDELGEMLPESTFDMDEETYIEEVKRIYTNYVSSIQYNNKIGIAVKERRPSYGNKNDRGSKCTNFLKTMAHKKWRLQNKKNE